MSVWEWGRKTRVRGVTGRSSTSSLAGRLAFGPDFDRGPARRGHRVDGQIEGVIAGLQPDRFRRRAVDMNGGRGGISHAADGDADDLAGPASGLDPPGPCGFRRS